VCLILRKSEKMCSHFNILKHSLPSLSRYSLPPYFAVPAKTVNFRMANNSGIGPKMLFYDRFDNIFNKKTRESPRIRNFGIISMTANKQNRR